MANKTNHGFLIPSTFYGPSVDCRCVSSNEDPIRRELEAKQQRIAALESAARNLLTKIKDSTQDGVLTESDDHFFSVDDYIEIESIAPETTALESLLTEKPADGR